MTNRRNAQPLALTGIAIAAMSLLGACSSSPAATPPATTVKTPSLRGDVLPIFAGSCSTTSTCHGSPTGIEVFLAGGASNASSIRAGIVGVATAELPSMPFVTAGDPTKSYLMHKLDGDQASFTSMCVGGDCGKQMPRSAAPLDEATRETIRTWIAQGAQDN